MYFVLIVYTFYFNVLSESCTTPFNDTGECVPLRSCSSLLWSFTNPKDGMEEYLQKFVCSNEQSDLTVCCRKASEYLIFEDEEDDYDPNDITNVELRNSKNCGISNNSKIQSGEIRLMDFPWLIKIVTVNDSYEVKDQIENVGCTGVLISHWYALYSAQCHYSVLGDFDYSVRINIYTGGEETCTETSYSPHCSTFENYQIDDNTVHPFYDPQTKINDIAILRLSRRVHYSDFIQPICLPIHSDPVKVGHTLHTAGWKRTFSLNDFSVKTSQSSVYISQQECKNHIFKSGSNATLSNYEMCTYSERKASKRLDVGFPIMSLQGDQWYLEGFESQGENIKVGSRVQNYLYWIQQEIGVERCLTPYNQTGECTHLPNCPKLMHAFANPSPKDEDILWEFVCEYNYDDDEDDDYVLKVCCRVDDDLIIPPETNDKNLNFHISNFVYCGLQHPDDYISTDENISVDEFPWLATVVNATLPNQRDRLCGGSLITSRYVLTSAQCSYSFNDNDTMLVRLGDYNLNTSNCVELTYLGLWDCTDVQEYEIKKHIIHPFYNELYFLNDISLLRLNKTVTYSDYVRPICIPRTENDLANKGAMLYLTGFGNTRKGEQTSTKKKIPTTLISSEKCSNKLKFLRVITPITPYQICTQDFKNSPDVTCDGDYGGPVMYSKKFRWFIEGISSSYSCGGEDPQTHLSVFKYSKWIKLNMVA